MSYTSYEPDLTEDEKVILEHLGGAMKPRRRSRSRSRSKGRMMGSAILGGKRRKSRAHSRKRRVEGAAYIGGKRESPAQIERKIISLEKKLEKALRR